MSSGPEAPGTTGSSGLRGLRRFVDKPPAAAPTPADVLKRFTRPRSLDEDQEVCEMCGEVIAHEHPHVVNVESRSLLCTCRGCYLLFTQEGAAGGKYRAVPDRYLYDPAFRLSESQWDDIQIPVSMAFFFINSSMERFVSFYPSPAGATESLLDLGAWAEVIRANPQVPDLAPDVEAILLNKVDAGWPRPDRKTDAGWPRPDRKTDAGWPRPDRKTDAGWPRPDRKTDAGWPRPDRRTEERFECFLVPIDACYELVGLVKVHWKGFAGGEKVWEEVTAFLDRLRDRGRLVEHKDVDE
jgi:hypothetical protein